MIYKSRGSLIFLSILFFFIAFSQNQEKCCQTFDVSSTICMSCPEGTKLFGNRCNVDVSNCKKYSECYTCVQCESGFDFMQLKVKQIRVNKCQSNIVQTQINVQSKQNTGRPYQAFLTADQYMKAFHLKQLKDATYKRATHKKFKNQSQIVQIQYLVQQLNKSQIKFYKAQMFLDLNQFVFKEIDFKQIPESQLKQANSMIKQDKSLKTKDVRGTTTVYDNYSQNFVNLDSEQNKKFIKSVGLVTEGEKPIYKKILQMRIKSFKNNSQLVEVNYQLSNDQRQKVIVDPSTKQVIKIVPAEQNSNIKNNNIVKKQQKKIQQAVKPNQGYTQKTTVQLLKNTNYLLCHDYINKKLNGYQNLLPKTSFSKMQKDMQIFRLIFEKNDGNIMQISIKSKSSPPKTEFIYQKKIGELSKQINKIYIQKDLADIPKFSFFIPAAILIQKTSANYNPKNMVSFAINEQEPNLIYFKTIYCLNGNLYEVQTSTRKKLRTSKLVSQKTIQNTDCLKMFKENNLVQNSEQIRPQSSTTAVQIPLVKQMSNQVQVQTKSPEVPSPPISSSSAQAPVSLPTSSPASGVKNQIDKPVPANKVSLIQDSTTLTTPSLTVSNAPPVFTPLPSLITQVTVSPPTEKPQPTTQASQPAPSVQSAVQKKPQISQNTIKVTAQTATPLQTLSINTQPQASSPVAKPVQVSQAPIAQITTKQPNLSKAAETAATQIQAGGPPVTNQTVKTSQQTPKTAPLIRASSPSASTNSTSKADSVQIDQKNNNDNKVDQTRVPEFSNNQQLPIQVLNQVTGFIRLSQRQAIKNLIFLKVQNFVYNAHKKILKNSQIIGVFYRMAALTVQYKIFYSTPQKFVYQANLTYDKLRNKNYFINFGIVVYGEYLN